MITNSKIGCGDQLGAQMLTFANLYYIAKENSQDLIFFEELRNFRRGLQILDVFDLNEVQIMNKGKNINFLSKIYCSQFNEEQSWSIRMKRIYSNKYANLWDRLFLKFVQMHYNDFFIMNNLKSGVNCDTKLLNLAIDRNYDIQDGFGTYQDWKKYENELLQQFKFKDEIVKKGDDIWRNLRVKKETVSIHFRRTDYILMSSLNLTMDYYEKAVDYYEKEQTTFLVFSDAIDEVRNIEFFKNLDVIFMPKSEAGVDMYLMSKCKHNIIANSSFSFWGGYLNGNLNKKVVCPHDFVGKETEQSYINGNYYPKEWIAI